MASKVTVHVGGVPIGGGHPVVVQSMTDTDTADIDATVAQTLALADAGSELVRIKVEETLKRRPAERERAPTRWVRWPRWES